MHTDSFAMRVLCFGDSNTHGAPDDDPDYRRLPADRRWTGLLQLALGDGYEVIEEGLGGRTTDLDFEGSSDSNGRRYFAPCLLSHNPLDVVVVMLGTNDLQVCFGRTALDVAASLDAYLDDAFAHAADRLGRASAVVLVSPIWIDDTAARYAELTSESFDHTSILRSQELADEVRRVAGVRSVAFADAAQVARAGADGLHLSPDSHAPLAGLLATLVQELRPADAGLSRDLGS